MDAEDLAVWMQKGRKRTRACKVATGITFSDDDDDDVQIHKEVLTYRYVASCSFSRVLRVVCETLKHPDNRYIIGQVLEQFSNFFKNMEEYLSVKDLEDAALALLPKKTGDFYKGGATDENTLADNKRSFQRLRIRPKCFVGITDYSLQTTVLGEEVSLPVGISPTALQRMAHEEGELANVRAAQEERTIYILSSIATSTIEEVAAAAPDAIKWLQLFIFKDRELTRSFVQRAERSGFKALVLTADAPVIGIRRADIRNKFSLPHNLRLANFVDYFSAKIEDYTELLKIVQDSLDITLTWDDVKWLRSITKLPMVVKGVLRPDDAIKAAEVGCAGILVSNHGARQLDGVTATIEVLPDIVDAVKNFNVEVYMDGGVMNGADVYKALALGAKMVFVGRPALWGLAVGGQAGVQRMLTILRTELESAFHIAGTSTVHDISRDMVRHDSSIFSKL